MERTDDPLDRRTADEADSAAAEAGSIAERADDEQDPERRPVEEAGGGEAEGFERSEELLRERAEHEGPAPDPMDDAFPPEAESDRETADHGEPDEVEST